MTQTKVSNTFIDNNFPFRNLIINGDMNIAQRSTSTTGVSSASSFPSCDRFKLMNNGIAGQYTVTQTADGPGVFGLTKCFKMACTTADTSTAAAEYSFLATVLETQHLQHLRKGESDAKKLYLSFYAKGDAAVTYVVEVYDNEHDRIQSQTFTISTSWQRFTFEIPADTNGETLDDDNTEGLSLHFWLHAGSDFTSGTLSGSWANRNNTNRAAGIGSMLASTSRTFFLTGVQLELGGVSDFEQVPHDVQLQRCKRYFENYEVASGSGMMGVSFNANDATTRLEYKVTKRAAPTIGGIPTGVSGGDGFNFLTNAGSYSSAGSLSSHSISIDGCRINGASHGSLNNPGATVFYATGAQTITIDAEM
jgi:hypothetical protein